MAYSYYPAPVLPHPRPTYPEGPLLQRGDPDHSGLVLRNKVLSFNIFSFFFKKLLAQKTHTF